MNKSLVEVIEEDEATTLKKLIRSKSKHRVTQSFFELLKRLFFVVCKLGVRRPDFHLADSYAALGVMTTVQAIQILQIVSLEATFNHTPNKVWEVLAYFRADWWAFKLKVLSQFVIFCYAYITLCFLLIALAMRINDNRNRIFKAIRFVLRAGLSSVFDILLIPFMVVLVATMKYASSYQTTLSEYEDEPSENLNSSSILAFSSVVFFIMLNILVGVRLLAFGNWRYTPANLNDRSRCSNLYDFMSTGIGFSALAVSYFCAGFIHSSLFRGTVILLGIGLSYMLYTSLPYYKMRVNTMKFVSLILLGWSGIALEVENFMGNSVTGLVLIVFVSPILLFSTLDVCSSRFARLIKRANIRIYLTRNLIEFELCLRVKLGAAAIPEDLAEIQDIFSTLRLRCPDIGKMFDLYEIYFCIEVLEDRKLACVKLTNLLRPGFDIEAMYYEYCVRAMLNKKRYKSEELNYLEYRLYLEEVKQLDQLVTIKAYQMWHEFGLNKPSEDNLMKYFAEIDGLIDVVKERYDKLMQSFPEAPYIYELYSSFLKVVLNDNEASQSVLVKLTKLNGKNELEEQNKSLKNFSYFDENNGILIVDTDPGNFGKIAYANQRAEGIFGMPVGSFIGSDLNSFIPPPYNKNHREVMLNFVRTCKSTQLEHPYNLFVFTHSGFLKDCSLVAKITAVNTYPIFLVAVVDRPVTKEIAIIDEEGIIHCHTLGLPSHLGLSYNRLDGMKISEFLPIEVKDLKQFVGFSIKCKEKQVYLGYVVTTVNKVYLRLIFFFLVKEEYISWKKGTNHAAIQDLMQYIESPVITREEIAKTQEYQSPMVRSKAVQILVHSTSKETTFDDEDNHVQDRKIPKSSISFGESGSSLQLDSTGKARDQRKLQGKFTSALRLSRLSTYSCALFIVIANLSIMAFVTIRFKYIRQPEYIELFGDIAYETLYLGLNARLLSLVQEGIELLPVDEIRANLETASSSLKTHLNLIENSSHDLKDYGFDIFFENDFIRQWSLVNEQPTLGEKNIVDFVSNMKSSAVLLTTLPVEQAMLNNPDLYFVYRNGLAEGFITLNTTYGNYIKVEKQYVNDVEASLLTILGVSISFILLSLICTSASILWLQRCFEKLWVNMTSFNPLQALEMKQTFTERLMTHFGEDVIDGIQYNESQNLKVFHGKLKETIQVKITIWKGLYLKLSMLVVMTAILFIIFYYTSFANLKRTMLNYPVRIEISQQIRLDMLLMLKGVQETAIHTEKVDSSLSINSFYADFAKTMDDDIQHMNNQIERLSNPLFFTLSFDKKAMIADAIDSTDPYFRLGLHSATLTLLNEMSYFAEERNIEELQTFIRHCFLYTVYETEVIDSLRKERSNKIDNRTVEMIIITAINSAITLLLSYFVYKRMYRALDYKVQRLRKLLVVDVVSNL